MPQDHLPPLPELLEAVRGIAQRAGDIALGAMAQIEGEIKEDLTFVTAVDRKVEQFLFRELATVASGVGFLGEEYGQQGDTRRMWIVDPIDGTNNLIFGIPMWGISVGLAEEGESVLGVFHLPLLHETFYAYRGGGAFLNGTRIYARSARASYNQDCLGITTQVARDWDLTHVTGYYRLFGSIGAEVIYVAKGSLYAAVSLGDKLVDLGAAVCIVKEAGCEMTYLSGDPFHLQEWIDAPPRPEPLLVGPDWAVRELRETLKPR